jgi:protein involved in polysaccharide export with SLBB domain
MNYILGPGDELQVSVYGVQEYNAFRISRRKSIDSNVGEIFVSGISIQTQNKRLCPKYIVLLGQTISSCCQSESHQNDSSNYNREHNQDYSISSLATVYNALFLGGGPGKNESYRNIELIRNNSIY